MEKLTGHGIPSAHLVGEVGQHYEDLNTGDLYECRIAEKYSPTHGWPVGGYVWEKRATGEDIQELFGSGGGSGGGVTSWDDLQDKPFGVTTIYYPLITEETNIKAGSWSEVGGEYTPAKEANCIVWFDNEEIYDYVQVTPDGTKYIGNYSIITDDESDNNGLPYVAYWTSDNDDVYSCTLHIKALDTTNDHTIDIVEPGNDWQTIDPSYLPKADAVDDLTEAPTMDDFNALLASLRAAGYLAE